MASPNFEVGGRPSETAVELERLIQRGLIQTKAVETESLCIVGGSKVWSVRCDLIVLDHGGNLGDACMIAAVAALSHFRRPDVTVTGKNITVHPKSAREPVPLSLHHVPLSVTFAFMDNGVNFVVDPSLKEELVFNGKMTLTLTVQGDLCTINKSGSPAMSPELLLQCTQIAAVKVSELHTVLQGALAEAAAAGKQQGLKRVLGAAAEAGGAAGPSGGSAAADAESMMSKKSKAALDEEA
jgi:exosome complex component RRP45